VSLTDSTDEIRDERTIGTCDEDDAEENDADDAMEVDNAMGVNDATPSVVFVFVKRTFELARKGFFRARWVVCVAVGGDASAK